MSPEPIDYDSLYREYAPKVRALARRRLPGRDISDDVVQEVFIRAFRALPGLSVEPGRSLWPWLRTICINVCTDVLRAPRTWAEESVSDVPEPSDRAVAANAASAADPLAAWLAGQRRQAIADALDTLAPRQREVLLRRVVDGASSELLAESDGSTPEAIKSAVKRGRETFRRAYQQIAGDRGLLGGANSPPPALDTLGTRVRSALERMRGLMDSCMRTCSTDPVWQSLPVAVSAALFAVGVGVGSQLIGDHPPSAAAATFGGDPILARGLAGAAAPNSPSSTARPGGGGQPPSAPPGHDQGGAPPPARGRRPRRHRLPGGRRGRNPRHQPQGGHPDPARCPGGTGRRLLVAAR